MERRLRMAKSSIPFAALLCWEGNGIAVAVWLSSLGAMGGGLVRIGKGGFFGGDREKRAWACFWSGFGKRFGL